MILALATLAVFLPGPARAQVGFGTQPVNAPVTNPVVVTLNASGTLGVIEVLTWGAQGADFTAASAGSTFVAGELYSAGQTCSVSVVFTPAYPCLRAGAARLLDKSGNVMATEHLTGTGIGALGILVPGSIHTIAGNGQWVTMGDGQLATSAGLFLPAGLTVDGAGSIYIADSIHNWIRRVDSVTGIISTVAGNGDAGYAGDKGPAVKAKLSGPRGVTLAASNLL